MSETDAEVVGKLAVLVTSLLNPFLHSLGIGCVAEVVKQSADNDRHKYGYYHGPSLGYVGTDRTIDASRW